MPSLCDVARSGNFGLYLQLLNKGFDPNYQDNYGNTSLHYLLAKYSYREYDTFKKILNNNNIDVDIVNNDGESVLSLSLYYIWDDDLVLLMMSKSKNLYHKNKNGNNILHISVFLRPEISFIQKLINKLDSSIQCNNDENQKPHDVALQSNNIDIYNLLVSKYNIIISQDNFNKLIHTQNNNIDISTLLSSIDKYSSNLISIFSTNNEKLSLFSVLCTVYDDKQAINKFINENHDVNIGVIYNKINKSLNKLSRNYSKLYDKNIIQLCCEYNYNVILQLLVDNNYIIDNEINTIENICNSTNEFTIGIYCKLNFDSKIHCEYILKYIVNVFRHKSDMCIALYKLCVRLLHDKMYDVSDPSIYFMMYELLCLCVRFNDHDNTKYILNNYNLRTRHEKLSDPMVDAVVHSDDNIIAALMTSDNITINYDIVCNNLNIFKLATRFYTNKSKSTISTVNMIKIINKMNKKTLSKIDADGRLCIHYACMACDPIVIIHLINMGFDTNIIDIHGNNCMYYICINTCNTNISLYEKPMTMLINKSNDINHINPLRKETCLHYASKYFSLKMIKLLLNMENILIDVKNSDNITPLMYLCQRQFDDCEIEEYDAILIEMVKATKNINDIPIVMVAKKCSLKTLVLLMEYFENNPKHEKIMTDIICKKKLYDEVHDTIAMIVLLKYINNIDRKINDDSGNSLIHCIVDTHKHMVIDYTIAYKNPMLHVKNKDGNMPLNILLSKLTREYNVDIENSIELVMLKYPRALCNVTETNCPLILICSCGSHKLIMKTFETIKINKINVNVCVTDFSGNNILHILCTRLYSDEKFTNIVCATFHAFTQLHGCKNDSGIYPMNLLASVASNEIINFILNNDININYCDIDNVSFLQIILEHRPHYIDDDLLIKLINKSNINTKDANGMTTLHYACKGGKLSIVKYLIENKKMKVNVKGSGGIYPIHYAIISIANTQNVELLEYLMKHKDYNCDIKTDNKMTLLHFAVETENIKCFELLIDSGVDIFATCINDKIMIRFNRESVSVLKELIFVYENKNTENNKNILRYYIEQCAMFKDLNKDDKGNYEYEKYELADLTYGMKLIGLA